MDICFQVIKIYRVGAVDISIDVKADGSSFENPIVQAHHMCDAGEVISFKACLQDWTMHPHTTLRLLYDVCIQLLFSHVDCRSTEEL